MTAGMGKPSSEPRRGTARKEVRAVFLGAPGAGKGTQALRLSEALAMVHISTGDMLRKHVSEGTELGRKAKGYMESGRLVPDELILAMVADRIRKPDVARAWILDGFPRTLPQAKALDGLLQTGGSKGLSHVIFFAVPEEVLVRRLSGRQTCSRCGAIWNTYFQPTRAAGVCDTCGGELRQRADDRPEAVRKRLDVYHAETEPVLGYYRSLGLLTEIDADRSPEEVFQSLSNQLEPAN